MTGRQCFRDSLSTPKFWNKLNAGSAVPVAPAEIKNIQLVVLSANDIRKQSVCQLDTTTLYEKSLPRAYGINDIRMGTVDRKLRCGTCLNGMVICNGHAGHIELPMPVYHISYISDLVKILRCICPHCFRNVCGPTDSNFLHITDRLRSKERYVAICNYVKNKKNCGHEDCGQALPKYNQQGFTIKREWPAQLKPQLDAALAGPCTPQTVHDLLEMVEDDVFVALGLNPLCTHPCSFILSVLVVPPPIIRPSIMFSESCRTRGQDDLTHKLQEILKQCQKVKSLMEDEEEITSAFELLQALVATYMNNETAGSKLPSKKRSGQPEKCVVKRLKGKRGRFRGNLMGKRVDFTARTVISPDCVMDVDEIGIPPPAALKLTFVEVVNRLNIAQLQARVLLGAGQIDGAKSIIKENGQAISLEMCKHRENIRLQVGWSVERYMQNGDTVLFNRQPSLRKKSMMAHTVKIMPGNTFRLNLCCTGPYNGDFDGDEMNLHMLQRLDAVVEAKQLMSVSSSLLNAQSNKPCMGIVQDSLVGAYLLTQNSVFLTRAEMCQLMMHIKYPQKKMQLPIPAVLKPVPLWSGKQAMSLIIPPICLVKKDVVIRHGELVQGVLCKQTLGATSGGIIDVTCKMIDNDTALRFMSDCQRLVNSWMEGYGFSVGIDDCLINQSTQQKIDSAVDACLTHIAKVDAVGKTLSVPFKYREGHVSSILSRMLNVTGGLVQEQIKPDNALMAMVTAGSKGNPINISQISGCVGQQSIEGHRIFDEDNPADRTLACFPHGADSATSRGFVRHSYIAGLSPAEVFFHAMGGREGIVDTSVKTADTGYLQRRIVKALESITIEYDQTVRESSGNIVEYRYGGDNCDAAYLDKVSLSFITLTRQQLELDYGDFQHELPVLLALVQDCLACKITLLSTQLTTDAHLPVNITSIIGQIRPDKSGALVTTEEVGPAVAALLHRFCQLEEQTLFLRASLAYHLRSSELVSRLRLTTAQFRGVLAQIDYHYQRAQVNPGEMVGVLAAESVGEPCTQLTLNTFHHAGVAEKNVTLGVPRIKELIDARYVNQTPSTDLFLRAPFSGNKRFVDKFKETLPETYLKDVMQSFDVLLDPDPASTTVQHEVDQFLLRTWQQFGTPLPAGASRYVIRIVLNRELLKAKELTVSDVRNLLISKLPGRDMYHLLSSEPNMREWIVRIRMCGIAEMRQHAMAGCKQQAEQLVLEFEKNMAHAFLKYISRVVHICGIKGVERATVQQQTTTQWDKDTLEKTSATEYYVQTSGVNLREFWNIGIIDWKRCLSNSVFEVLELLGIEATALVLFHEIKTVLSFDGCYVNNRHIMMIVNIMTRTGSIMPLNRHGLNRLEVGPLVKCTFEETVDIIFEAGLFGENNPVTSISDSIMVGQPIPGGTGKMELQMDPGYEKAARHKALSKATTAVIRTFYSEFANRTAVKQKREATTDHQVSKKIQLDDLRNFEHASSLFHLTSPSPTSPTHHPTSPSPTSPTYLPSSPTYHPTSPSPTSPTWCYPPSPVYSPKKITPPCSPIATSLSTVQRKAHEQNVPEADEQYAFDYVDGTSVRGTDIQQLESIAIAPMYGYRPSTPLLGDHRAPSSPCMVSRPRSTVSVNCKTIKETLQLIVPNLLSTDTTIPSSVPSLYHQETGQLDLQSFQTAVDQWNKEI